MNLNWITEPLAFYGALAAGYSAALYLFLSNKTELRRQAIRHELQTGELRRSLGELEARFAGLAEEAAQEARLHAAAVSGPLPRGINVQKRAEALRMCRRGADRQTIAARLGLSHMEVLLLEKVQQSLVEAPLDQLNGSLQERSSSLEYSLEA